MNLGPWAAWMAGFVGLAFAMAIYEMGVIWLRAAAGGGAPQDRDLEA